MKLIYKSESLRHLKIMKRTLLFIGTIILLSISVIATNQLQGDSPWSVTNWKNDEASTAVTPHTFGDLDYYSTFTTIPPDSSSTNLPYGSTLQHLTIDINNDGTLEIIGTYSTYVVVFRVNSHNVIELLTQYDTSKTLSWQFSIYNSTSPNGVGIVINAKNETMALEWNSTSSTLYKIRNFSMVTYGGVTSGANVMGWKCGSDFHDEDSCFTVSKTGVVIKYEPNTGVISNFTATGYAPASYPYPPSISDQNLDGKYEVAWVYNFGNNHAGYVVYDEDGNLHYSGSASTTTNDHISVGVTNLAFYYAQVCGGILWWKSCSLQGILGITTSTSTGDTGLELTYRRIQSNGVALSVTNVLGTSCAPCSANVFPFYGSFTANIKEVCLDYYTASTTNIITCYNLETMAVTQSMGYKKIKTHTAYMGGTGDYNADGYDEIITSSQIISPHNNNTFNFSLATTGTVTLSDVNNDDLGEIILSGTNTITVLFPLFQNDNAQYTTMSLAHNKDSPICLGSTLTLSAYQCGGGYNTCHYNNDNELDQERLVTDCGGNSIINGTFAWSPISVSCLFNDSSVSAVQMAVWLQDDKHLDDFTQVKTLSYIIINGTPGINCNMPVPYPLGENVSVTTITSAGGGGTLTQSDINILTDTLTGGGSALVKNILMLAFTISLIVFLATYGVANPVIYGIAVFALWMIGAILGLLSWIYVIIFGFVAIGLSAIIFVKGSSSQ